jgi:hypothetical protein
MTYNPARLSFQEGQVQRQELSQIVAQVRCSKHR